MSANLHGHVEPLATSVPKDRSIPPDKTKNVRDKVIEHLVNRQPGIRDVNLSFSEFHKFPVNTGALLSLSSLKSLRLVGCSLFENAFDVGKISAVNLQVLVLFNISISSAGFAAILNGCGSSLKTIDLGFSSVGDEGFLGFTGIFSNLRKFELSEGKAAFTDLGFHHLIKKCSPKLEVLDLSSRTATGDSLDYREMASLKLKKLYMSCGLSNNGLRNLLKVCASTLESLDIADSPITDTVFQEFKIKGMLRNIEHLALVDCKGLTDEGFLSILEMCGPSLNSVTINDTMITGEIACRFTGKLPNLESLNLCSSENLTRLGIYRCIKKFGTKLTNLELQDVGFTGNPLHHEQLQQHDVEEEGILLPKLKSLNLFNHDIDDIDEIHYWVLSMCGEALDVIIAANQISSECEEWIMEKFPDITLET